MSIKINQEINNIRNGVKNLNIATTDNTQAILDEAILARSNENNIFSALLVEKNRAQNAEYANEQMIFSETTRAIASEGTNVQSILDEMTRAIGSEDLLGQRITTEIADEVIRASGEEAAISLLILLEKTRAIASEGTNVQSILDETTRATIAETTLTTETERLTDEQNQLIGHNTHYGFRVCGTTYQNCNNGNILVFDNKTRADYGCHVVPDITAYNISTYKYTVPINGYYFFGFKLFMNSGPNDSDRRFGIYVNGAVYAFGGQYVGTGENVSLNKYCTAGDIIDVRCYIGPATVSLNPGHSWFYGWRIGI